MTRSLGFEDLDTSVLLVAKLLVELRALFKFCPVGNHNGWIDLALRCSPGSERHQRFPITDKKPQRSALGTSNPPKSLIDAVEPSGGPTHARSVCRRSHRRCEGRR